MRILALSMLVALAAGAVSAQTLTVKGLDGQLVSLGPTDLDALPQASVTEAIHGQTHGFQGPLLSDVLTKVAAPRGAALHGPELADVVVAQAADGYRVVFGLGETDPSVRPNRIILATRVDGAPLDASQGPYRIVVEGDLEPKRSARMVTGLIVERIGP